MTEAGLCACGVWVSELSVLCGVEGQEGRSGWGGADVEEGGGASSKCVESTAGVERTRREVTHDCECNLWGRLARSF